MGDARANRGTGATALALAAMFGLPLAGSAPLEDAAVSRLAAPAAAVAARRTPCTPGIGAELRSAAGGAPTATPPQPPAAAKPARPVVVPVEQVANVLFARVELNGRGPYWFTVDTGATLPVIDPATAGALSLPISEVGERRDVGIGDRPTRLQATRGVTIRVGGAAPFTPRRLFVVPVGANAAALGHRVDGVLGTDFLSRYNAEFDFRRGRLVLHEGPTPELPPGHAVATIRVDANRPLVRAVLTLPDDARVVASLLVDTGSNARSSLNSSFVRAHRLTRFPSLGLTASLGVNGVTTASGVRLGARELGSAVVDGPELALSSATSGMNADGTFDGILTTDLLGRFRVFVDYPGARLMLVR